MGSTAWRNNIVKWSRLATFNPWALWEARLNMKELPCRLRVLYVFLVISYQQSLVEGRQQVPSDRKGKARVNTIPLNHKSSAQGHQLPYRWQPPQPVHVKVNVDAGLRDGHAGCKLHRVQFYLLQDKFAFIVLILKYSWAGADWGVEIGNSMDWFTCCLEIKERFTCCLGDWLPVNLQSSNL